MPVQALSTLEFPALLKLLQVEAQSERGKKLVSELLPSDDFAAVTERLALTTEARRFFIEIGRISVGDLADPTPILDELRIGGTRLEPDQVLSLVKLMQTGADLRDQFRPARAQYPALATVFDRLPNLHKLMRDIRRILLPTGEIDEQASPELRRLRREIQTQRTRIQRQLESLLSRKDLETAFSDQIVTQRNGRFVVPVRNDHRGHVQGVVHSMSSSGVTAFVEPLATIELNNEMVRLQELEEAEIAKLLFQISEWLRADLDHVTNTADTLAEIDFITAKAKFADAFNAVEPTINTEGSFALAEARHPLLEANFRRTGGSVVPVSFSLSRVEHVMVVSGPNAGGKTVVMKTAGLCALMAQCGLHVPAKTADLCLFRQIQADIGDHQSIAANLSTFSSHITNINRIIREIETPALVLIDEIGTGTDPDEGAALAVALTDRFRTLGVHLIVSTHYNPMKVFADSTPGVFNSAVEFNFETLQPTYRLLVKQAGTSSGLQIAGRLGLDPKILESAGERLGSREAEMTKYLDKLKAELDYQHDSTIALEEERAVLAERFAKLDLEFAHREQARQKVFAETLDSVREDFMDQVRPLLERISNQAERKRLGTEADRAVEREVRKAGEKFQKPPQLRLVKENRDIQVETVEESPEAGGRFESGAEIRVGDAVRTELGQEGVVEAVEPDYLLVRVGAMRLKTAPENVRKPLKPKPTARGASPAVVDSGLRFNPPSSSDLPLEINLIGCNADEAVSRADKFLDEAVMSRMSRIRIVHGVGMGVLKREIEALLQGHPHVARFYRAPGNEGGSGATVVELRM